jgi:hypothetical protein
MNTRKVLEVIGVAKPSSASSTTNVRHVGGRMKRQKNILINETNVIEEYAGAEEEEIETELDEIDRYINTKLSMSSDDTLLGWWNKHSLIFPQLAVLAKSVFGIPASSATAERVFSSTGRILNKGRQSLSGDIVDDILMIRNFRSI